MVRAPLISTAFRRRTPVFRKPERLSEKCSNEGIREKPASHDDDRGLGTSFPRVAYFRAVDRFYNPIFEKRARAIHGSP